MGEMLVFLAFSFGILISSAMVAFGRNPVACAISLVGNLFLLAGVYAQMGADFAAAVQVIVYAGAIVVLFVFVIMLLNLRREDVKRPKLPTIEWLAVGATGLAFLYMALRLLLGQGMSLSGARSDAFSHGAGNTHAVAMKLFQGYLWPFELASFLILLGIVASIVIAKRPTPSGGDAKRSPVPGKEGMK